MHRRPPGHLDRFEIQLYGLATVLKDNPEQSAYFAFDLLTDRFRRLFPAQSACLPAVWRGNIFIRFDQGAAQFPITPEAGDLPLDFPLRRRARKTPRNRLAPHLVRESQVRAMAWIVRLMTMAVRIATAASRCRNRARTEITLSISMSRTGCKLKSHRKGHS
jgi:hypothetical protein